MDLAVAIEQVEYYPAADGIAGAGAREPREFVAPHAKRIHPPCYVGDIECLDVPAREYVIVLLPHVLDEPLDKRPFVIIDADGMDFLAETGRTRIPTVLECHRIHAFALVEEEGGIGLFKRVPAGNAYDPVTVRFREPVCIITFDIQHADTGRCGYIRRTDLGIGNAVRGCDHSAPEPQVYHKTCGKWDISLVMCIALTDLPDISRSLSDEPAEECPLDRSEGVITIHFHTLRRRII